MDESALRRLLLDTLDRAYIAHLATADAGGPWSSPVHIHHDGFDLYWRSAATVRHSAAITADPRIAVSIVISDAPDAELAIQAAGTASLTEIDPALRDRFLGSTVRSKEDAKRSARPWYVLRPDFLELVDTVRFGYDKKRLDLL